MITKQVTAANTDEKIKKFYETAFPEDEQIPGKIFCDSLDKCRWTLPAYYEGENS